MAGKSADGSKTVATTLSLRVQMRIYHAHSLAGKEVKGWKFYSIYILSNLLDENTSMCSPRTCHCSDSSGFYCCAINSYNDGLAPLTTAKIEYSVYQSP